MKNIITIYLLILITAIIGCNNSQNNTQEIKEKSSGCSASKSCGGCSGSNTIKEVESSMSDTLSSNVMVYYFHSTRRCATCVAVEKVTKETIEKSFAEDVNFMSVNREENTELATKFKISGQALIVTHKNKIVDLTNEAFLNARNNPEKYVEKLSSVISTLL